MTTTTATTARAGVWLSRTKSESTQPSKPAERNSTPDGSRRRKSISGDGGAGEKARGVSPGRSLGTGSQGKAAAVKTSKTPPPAPQRVSGEGHKSIGQRVRARRRRSSSG